MSFYKRLQRGAAYLILLALSIALAGCGGAPAATSIVTAVSAEDQAIQTAVQAHLARQAVSPAERIDIEGSMDEIARVRITYSDSSIGPTTGYLQRQGATWKILGIGTAFDADFYNRYAIPEHLQLTP